MEQRVEILLSIRVHDGYAEIVEVNAQVFGIDRESGPFRWALNEDHARSEDCLISAIAARQVPIVPFLAHNHVPCHRGLKCIRLYSNTLWFHFGTAGPYMQTFFRCDGYYATCVMPDL
jgi:hypothetical protein